MPLLAGTRMGPYEILAAIGAGGMGEVYRARDTRLGREVAIKMLRRDGHARLLHEARAVSALNHPNILGLYDIGSENGSEFLVMELVRGKTLDQIIGNCGIVVNEAVKYAIPIADALARAHAAGILHRDLKPSNIMISADGVPKILDFGLAQAAEPENPGGDQTQSLTGASERLVAGTPAYMSPEQAEGKKLDARSDIFSFGAVLYEMVTGRRAFRGDSTASTLAAVLHHEPHPPANIPKELERIIQRCLRKDPNRRFQHMSDLKVELEEVLEDTASGIQPVRPVVSQKQHRIVWAAVAVVLGLTAGLSFWITNPKNEATGPEPPGLYRFTSYPGVETMPAFSPDGKQIAYVRAEHDPIDGGLWGKRQGQANIYLKLVGAAAELRLTNHPGVDYYPAWSPDGQYIAFYRSEPGVSGFYIVSAFGGEERRITRGKAGSAGLAWLPDGRHLVVSLVYEGSHPSPLYKISLDTGERHAITSPPGKGMGDALPAISPDGKTLAFVRFKDSGAADLCVVPLSGGAPRCRPLHADWPWGLTWTASGDSIIVSAMRTGPFQLWRYRLGGGTPTAVTSGEEDAIFPTSPRQGNQLAYVLSRRNVNLWELKIDNPQAVTASDARPIASSTRTQADPAFSPDGRKIAFLSDRSGTQEIWITDREAHTFAQLTHFGGPPTGSPSWSPDGLEIAFDSQQGARTDIYAISAEGGAPRRITTGPGENCVPSWSADGKSIYFASNRNGDFQIWMAPAATGETVAHPAVQVTRGGGFRAFESSDGKYLYYAKGRGKPGLWRRNLSDGKEEPVFESLQRWGWWALGPDVIYFFEAPSPVYPEVHLKAFDIPTRRIRDLGMVRYPIVEGTVAVAASRDGRHLVFTQIDSMDADIMLAANVR
ncbi:MAG TPA: protein kinase [Bryobacteraceae bacterium]